MIEVRGVTKRYGATTVLDDVSVSIPRGGVVALVGPNGAGKSTLLSVIGRLLDADAGTVLVDGADVRATPSNELAKRLSILRQDNHLPVRLSVRELVEFGRFPHSNGRFRAHDREHVEHALERLGLTDLASRRLDQLSGGQRQRAFIAMVLCQDTDYVLLDEPLNNLDLRHAVQTMDLVRRLADELDKTVLVVLHDVNVAAGHADRMLALRSGALVADGPPDEIVRSDVLRDVFGVDLDVRHVDGRPVAMHFAPTARAAAGAAS